MGALLENKRISKLKMCHGGGEAVVSQLGRVFELNSTLTELDLELTSTWINLHKIFEPLARNNTLKSIKMTHNSNSVLDIENISRIERKQVTLKKKGKV